MQLPSPTPSFFGQGMRALSPGMSRRSWPSSPKASRFKVAGRNPVSGDYTGHDEVVGFFQKLGEGSNGTFTVSVQDILDNGDETVVALVTHLAQRDDAELDVPAVHLWTVQDGKCTSHVSYVLDVYAGTRSGHRPRVGRTRDPLFGWPAAVLTFASRARSALDRDGRLPLFAPSGTAGLCGSVRLISSGV